MCELVLNFTNSLTIFFLQLSVFLHIFFLTRLLVYFMYADALGSLQRCHSNTVTRSTCLRFSTSPYIMEQQVKAPPSSSSIPGHQRSVMFQSMLSPILEGSTDGGALDNLDSLAPFNDVSVEEERARMGYELSRLNLGPGNSTYIHPASSTQYVVDHSSVRAVFDPYFCEPVIRVSTGMQTEQVPTCPFPLRTASTPNGIPVRVQQSQMPNSTYIHSVAGEQLTQPNLTYPMSTVSQPNLNVAVSTMSVSEANRISSLPAMPRHAETTHIPPIPSLATRSAPNLNHALPAFATLSNPSLIPPIPTLPTSIAPNFNSAVPGLIAFANPNSGSHVPVLSVCSETNHMTPFSTVPVRLQSNQQNPQQVITRDQPAVHIPHVGAFDTYRESNTNATSVDDRNIITELVNRQSPCLSEHYSHVFAFFISLMPLFQLNLVAEHILMKYLLPKVHGNIARLFLEVASHKGSFRYLCNRVRHEIFCDRAVTDLANQYFFKFFQSATQPVGDYFRLMQSVFHFLQLTISENNAVTIIMENLLPEAIVALGGRPWPTSFEQLFNLTSVFNRQSVVLEQRLQALSYSSNAVQSLPSPMQLVPTPPPPFPRPHSGSHFFLRDISTDFKSSMPPNTYQPPARQSEPNSKPLPSNAFSSPTTNQAPRQCYNCGDPNHLRPQCPNLTAYRTPGLPHSVAPTNNTICNFCGKLGHVSQVCKQRIRSQGSGNENRAAW